MTQNTNTLVQVVGPPYAVDGLPMRWLLRISSTASSLATLLDQVGHLVAPQPCAAILRVYSEAPDASHVTRLTAASSSLDLLDRCEAVGVFRCEDMIRDRQAILMQLRDPSGPDDDEACIIASVQPRPVLFLHAGHSSIDLVCSREDADRVSAYLTQAALAP